MIASQRKKRNDMKLAKDFSDSFATTYLTTNTTYLFVNHLLNELSLSIKTKLLLRESVNEV